jgi:prepilin-type N-terminal cleavage/methylation domain-containing protein
MKMISRNCLKCCGRRGLTLVEVTVSLALLSTLLVGMLVAQDRHTRQIRTARRTINLVGQVDQLLYGWMEKNSAIPRQATGPLEGDEDLVWTTRPLPTANSRELEVDVVRLEVHHRRDLAGGPPELVIDLAVPGVPPTAEGE